MSVGSLESKLPRQWQKTIQIVRPFLTWFLVVVLVIAIRHMGGFQAMELSASDRIVRWSVHLASPDPSQVILAVATEEDIAQMGWPLSDQMLADILSKLLAKDPTVIGVDLYRDRPVGEGGEALHRLFLTDNRLMGITKLAGDGYAGVPPHPALLDSQRVGVSDVVMDPMGVVRRGLLYAQSGEHSFPSFSLAMALSFLKEQNIVPTADEINNQHLRLGKTTLPPLEKNDGPYVDMDSRGYQFILDYSQVAHAPLRYFNLQEIMEGTVPKREIQGKVVIFGVMASSVKDHFFTPIHLDNPIHGVQLHGLMTDQIIRMALLHKGRIHVISDLLEGVWIGLWSLMMIGFYVFKRLWSRGWLLLILSQLALFMVVYLAYQVYLLWLPWLPGALAMFMIWGLTRSQTSPQPVPYVAPVEQGMVETLSLSSLSIGDDATQTTSSSPASQISSEAQTLPLQNTTEMTAEKSLPGSCITLAELRQQCGNVSLGRYKIIQELGAGAMGVVFEGFDPLIKRRVALKVLSLPTNGSSEEFQQAKERFFQEAESCGRLKHTHIVSVFDFGDYGDLAFIAMEFIEGKDLKDHLTKETLLPVNLVVLIGHRIAQALDYAHQRGVIHRDLKPANIMFDLKDKSIKLTDFGIARLLEGESSRTRTGVLLGTPAYMSPEQINGHKADGRSDIFSLGATLYHLLTGEKPFRGRTMANLLHKISNVPHFNALELRPDLPPCLGAILDKALAKAPEDRYQRGNQMAADLSACYKSFAKGGN
ncbi:MAG: CHASE2 domain-containing protein [Magnetococcales bacterium]|nr:CHASE2 domain-containing protein [Magnetococcales bacterium]